MSHPVNLTDYHFINEYDPAVYKMLRMRKLTSFAIMAGMVIITVVLLVTVFTQFWALIGAVPSLILLVIAIHSFTKARMAFAPVAARRALIKKVFAFFAHEQGVGEVEYPRRVSFWLQVSSEGSKDGVGRLRVILMPRDEFMLPQEFLVGETFFATRRGSDLAIIFPLIVTALTSLDIVGDADDRLNTMFLTKLIDAEQTVKVTGPLPISDDRRDPHGD